MQDEVKALQLCQNKVRQKKLPMDVIDAEYQWSDWVFFGERLCLLIPTAGIDVNSLFTSLRTSESTSESWYGNCSGARSVFRYYGRLLIRRCRLYKTRIWMASLQGPAGFEQ